jgi:hypothetical protein
MANPQIIARRLLRQNRGTRKFPARSWRQIAMDHGADKKHNAAFCRFANSQGTWIPKDEQLQIALGLKRAKKPRMNRQPTQLIDMCVDELIHAIEHREEMPEPTYNKRVMDAFIKACKHNSALRRSAT